ncbi:MAG: nuclease [Edaphobacter sp.]|uniref:nuclease n=1 Tax=Edaphobacter sp. TaxID=1934404 RepID=UPI002385370B|nr:nuclease [Edaphobacter sp.]MDE1176484.1 nuclease [Edaphobacter sp.]
MAQQTIGTVGISDATVSGALEVTNGRAVLRGASTVTAKDRTAEITLNRGGSIRVCATSGLHVTAGKATTETPLLLALDRGAVEVTTRATENDVLMTPDLRFTLKSAGVLDLRVRVARNGDTCVENRGAAAPVMTVADQFGEASYEVHAGQHLLFEHGSLKEVVDHESEPCGCPAEPVVSVAEAGVTGANAAHPGSEIATKTVVEQHPFPAAVSAGLSPASSLPPTPPGQVHAQVSTTMSYDTAANGKATGSDGAPPTAPVFGNAGQPSSSSAAQPAGAAPDSTTGVRAEAPPPPPAPSAGNIFHSIGHFFKRLFGGG